MWPKGCPGLVPHPARDRNPEGTGCTQAAQCWPPCIYSPMPAHLVDGVPANALGAVAAGGRRVVGDGGKHRHAAQGVHLHDGVALTCGRMGG